MLKSMTGFGAATCSQGEETVTVEIRSVNHRYCEVRVRSPRELEAKEHKVVLSVKSRLARGSVEVSVRRTPRGGEVKPTIDVPLATALCAAYREVSQSLGLSGEISLRDLLIRPEVVRLEAPTLVEADAAEALEQATRLALDALVEMRVQEGRALRTEFLERLARIEERVRGIQALAPTAVQAYRERLHRRIAEVLKDSVHRDAVQDSRLEQEVAIFAEKSDVAEELARLATHLVQLRALLDAPEPSGRKMDFLVQELNREVNTIGSKSQHEDIGTSVVELKAELERVREQVQNIE